MDRQNCDDGRVLVQLMLRGFHGQEAPGSSEDPVLSLEITDRSPLGIFLHERDVWRIVFELTDIINKIS